MQGPHMDRRRKCPKRKNDRVNQPMFFFHATPSGYRNNSLVLREFSQKRNETLGEYYIARTLTSSPTTLRCGNMTRNRERQRRSNNQRTRRFSGWLTATADLIGFKMNREEKIAKVYLKSLGFKNVVFEPDGNIPPDFSIDGRIAVEVRRLNQNFFTKDEAQGLKEARIPLFRLLQSSLSEFDSHYERG